MIANENVVKTRPEACVRVVRALQTGIDYAKANPAKVVEFISRRTRTDVETTKGAIADFDLGLAFDEKLAGDIVEQAQWSIDNKFSPRPPGDLKAFFRSLMYIDAVKAVRPAAVTIA